MRSIYHFNPRSPHGERRHDGLRLTSGEGFQPTLPARGATTIIGDTCPQNIISTHAPRTGSDLLWRDNRRSGLHFNPRSPHGERPQTDDDGIHRNIFQPTLPARGATVQLQAVQRSFPISTHAPRTGSDFALALVKSHKTISTHAPRTGSDSMVRPYRLAAEYFNPRSPHGERRFTPTTTERSSSFQPTLPARGATPRASAPAYTSTISTHAPRTGSDRRRPRVPLGTQISTHAPRTGSDRHRAANAPDTLISTHAPRTGSDQADGIPAPVVGDFNPRSPHGERLQSVAAAKKSR